uniref:Beta-1,3-galactosyl-O-glycosyl-glycoprotein beta-1,6-N-acetylglucosaminyltransferase 4 n=1 Tax=Micrurus spixii TaxID=129469 RepID=A0A2D4N5V6_9SAUR
MKKRKCFNICPIRWHILILFLTVVLLLLLKDDWILFFHKNTYFVEPFLSASSLVKNKYSHVKKYDQYRINCSLIYDQDPMEIGKVLEIKRKKIIDLEDEDVIAMTTNCQEYRTIREYHLKAVSPEEEEFPLAYSLVVHKDAIMVERLIHTIYSSQNVYCIHYDQKSSETFKQALENLAKCFSNIFIASKMEVVSMPIFQGCRQT